jgi:ADP-ribose pyrophosphatase YjhB (NUDIX family)
MATILCHDVEGHTIPVASEAVIFRPAVYGILIEHNQVLLQKHPDTALWQPPGAVLLENETPAQTIRHAFRQLTGMSPRLGPMLFVEEQYVIDGEQRAWHFGVVYYALERPSTATTLAQSNKIEWVALDSLQRQQMQFGYEAVQAGRLQLKL